MGRRGQQSREPNSTNRRDDIAALEEITLGMRGVPSSLGHRPFTSLGTLHLLPGQRQENAEAPKPIPPADLAVGETPPMTRSAYNRQILKAINNLEDLPRGILRAMLGIAPSKALTLPETAEHFGFTIDCVSVALYAAATALAAALSKEDYATVHEIIWMYLPKKSETEPPASTAHEPEANPEENVPMSRHETPPPPSEQASATPSIPPPAPMTKRPSQRPTVAVAHVLSEASMLQIIAELKANVAKLNDNINDLRNELKEAKETLRERTPRPLAKTTLTSPEPIAEKPVIMVDNPRSRERLPLYESLPASPVLPRGVLWRGDNWGTRGTIATYLKRTTKELTPLLSGLTPERMMYHGQATSVFRLTDVEHALAKRH